eukprot:2102456-Alexandrium_andersonii.AAC.1
MLRTSPSNSTLQLAGELFRHPNEHALDHVKALGQDSASTMRVGSKDNMCVHSQTALQAAAIHSQTMRHAGC